MNRKGIYGKWDFVKTTDGKNLMYNTVGHNIIITIVIETRNIAYVHVHVDWEEQ